MAITKVELGGKNKCTIYMDIKQAAIEMGVTYSKARGLSSSGSVFVCNDQVWVTDVEFVKSERGGDRQKR